MLVVHGERDAQVPKEHAHRVAGALTTRDGAVEVLPGLDHFLMATAGGISSYGDTSRRVAGAALTRVGEWLEDRLR